MLESPPRAAAANRPGLPEEGEARTTVTAPPQLRAGPGPGGAGTAAAVIQTDALTKRYTAR